MFTYFLSRTALCQRVASPAVVCVETVAVTVSALGVLKTVINNKTANLKIKLYT